MSNELVHFSDLVEFHDFPVMPGNRNIGVLVPTQHYSIDRLQDMVISSHFNLLFVFKRDFAVDFLHLDSESELSWALLRHLAS